MAKRIKSANIEMIGRTTGPNPCPVCKDTADPWLSNAAARAKGAIQYKKIEIDSPEGRAHPEYNEIDKIPHTKVCTTDTKGKQSCKTVKGWNENEFKDLESLFQ